MSAPIVNAPTAVTTYLAPPTGVHEPEYVTERKRRLAALAAPSSKIICHPVDAADCEMFPDWMIEAGPRLLKHQRIRRRILQNPLLAVKVMLSCYEPTFASLETTVLSDGEATIPLLCAIDDGKIVPAQSRSVYETALLEHPFWALRYLHTPCPPSAEAARTAFFGRFTAHVNDRRDQQPTAALAYLLSNPTAPVAPQIDLLHGDPLVAYMASRLLVARGFRGQVANVRALTPRWAVHIALYGGFSGGNVTPEVESAIAMHPGWAGEYIARSESQHRDWNWVGAIYKRMEEHCMARGASEPDFWAEKLWAMLDRIAKKVSGQPHNLTIEESRKRSKPATPSDTPTAS